MDTHTGKHAHASRCAHRWTPGFYTHVDTHTCTHRSMHMQACVYPDGNQHFIHTHTRAHAYTCKPAHTHTETSILYTHVCMHTHARKHARASLCTQRWKPGFYTHTNQDFKHTHTDESQLHTDTYSDKSQDFAHTERVMHPAGGSHTQTQAEAPMQMDAHARTDVCTDTCTPTQTHTLSLRRAHRRGEMQEEAVCRQQARLPP